MRAADVTEVLDPQTGKQAIKSGAVFFWVRSVNCRSGTLGELPEREC